MQWLHTEHFINRIIHTIHTYTILTAIFQETWVSQLTIDSQSSVTLNQVTSWDRSKTPHTLHGSLSSCSLLEPH